MENGNVRSINITLNCSRSELEPLHDRKLPGDTNPDTDPGKSLRITSNNLMAEMLKYLVFAHNHEQWRIRVTTLLNRLSEALGKAEEANLAMDGPPAKPPANEMNGTEQNGTIRGAYT
jgi:hypothetical protein